MVLRDGIEIKGPPERVWSHISDPGELRKWNGGIKAIVPVSAGAWAAGSRWRVRYEFHGRENNYLAEALELERPVRLVIHLTGGDMPVNGYMLESYELTTTQKGTLLTRSFALSGSGMHFFLGWTKFLFHHIFRRRHKRYLLKLKERSERGGEN